MARSDRVSLTYTADIGDIRRKLKQIPDLTAAEVRQATSALNKATRQTQRAAQRGRRDSEAFSTSLAAVGAAATGAVVGLGMMAQSVADARNNLTDLSTRSGVARETIAGLKVAADGSGVSFSKIEGILGRLPKTMSDVQAGSKRQADAFRALGVSVTNADGTLRSADAVFRESIQAIGSLATETDKAAAATQLFGRQGTYLLQALGDPAALESFVSLASRSAIAMEANANAAAQFQRDMAVLTLQFESFKATFTDLTGLENFPIIVAGIVKGAETVFEEFFQYFRRRVEGVKDVFLGLADLDFDRVGDGLYAIARSNIFGDRGLIATGIDAYSEAHFEIRQLARSVGELRSATRGAEGLEFRFQQDDELRGAADPTADLKAREAATLQLQAISEKANLAILEGEAKLSAEYRRQMLAINELEVASGDREAANRARAATREEYEIELWNLRRERARQEAEEEQRLAQETHDKQVQMLQLTTQARQQATDLYLASAQLTAQTLSEVFEPESAAARAFFVLSQSLAAGMAIMQAHVAAVAALAPPPVGLGPVAGAPLSTATLAFGYAQAAAIGAQTVAAFADTPGVMRADYSGMTASFAPGDLVVAGRDEGDLVRQMQRAGIGSGGTQVLIRDTDSHRGRYGRDPLRAPDRYGLIKRRAGRIPGRR